MNVFQWLRYGPWLAQVVVTRRCNLTCGYCTEYDRTSDPAPYDELALASRSSRSYVRGRSA